jgi:hypothetical protein
MRRTSTPPTYRRTFRFVLAPDGDAADVRVAYLKAGADACQRLKLPEEDVCARVYALVRRRAGLPTRRHGGA